MAYTLEDAMATEVMMPKLGMTMVEGTVEVWLAPDGATVTAGQPLYRLTTDKVDFEVEADTSGVVCHAVTAGTVVPTGAVVAFLLAPGEAPPVTVGAAMTTAQGAPAPTPSGRSATVAPAGGSGPRVRASPAARRLARELGVDLALVPAGADGSVHETDVRSFRERAAARPAAGEVPPPRADEVRISPLARRLADQHGIDVRWLRGSGPGGRIVQEDVERAIAGAGGPLEAPAASHTPAREVSGVPTRGTSVPFVGMRRTIAERMHGSLQQMAQLTITTEADVTDVVRLRGQLVEDWQRDGVRPTYTDLVVKAVAKSLPEHPRVNATLDGEVIRFLEEINIGIAIALDEGLIVPVLRNADRTPLKRIARESADLAERARSAKLGLDDVSGGTFTVTTLGMYEVDSFTPIVNPPQVAILGVGRVRDSITLEGREVIARKSLSLSLSFDHRVLDGAPAAMFLRRVKQLLERPYLLLVEDD